MSACSRGDLDLVKRHVNNGITVRVGVTVRVTVKVRVRVTRQQWDHG